MINPPSKLFVISVPLDPVKYETLTQKKVFQDLKLKLTFFDNKSLVTTNVGILTPSERYNQLKHYIYLATFSGSCSLPASNVNKYRNPLKSLQSVLLGLRNTYPGNVCLN